METIAGKLQGWKSFETTFSEDEWGKQIAGSISAGSGIMDGDGVTTENDAYLEFLNGSSNPNDGFYCCYVSDEKIMATINRFYSDLSKSGAGTASIMPGTGDAPAFKLKTPVTEIYHEVEIYLQVVLKVTRSGNMIKPDLGFRICLFKPDEEDGSIKNRLVIMRVDKNNTDFLQWTPYCQSDGSYYYKVLYNDKSHSTAVTFGSSGCPLFIFSESIRVPDSTATRSDMVIFLINKISASHVFDQTVYLNIMAPDMTGETVITHYRHAPIFTGSDVAISILDDSYSVSVVCQLFGWDTRYVSYHDKFLYRGPTSALTDFQRCRDDSGNYYVYLNGFLLYDPDK